MPNQKPRLGPFIHNENTVQKIMGTVLLALIPGVMVQTWYFGLGVVTNVGIAVATALIAEAWVVRLKKQSIPFVLSDLSAVLTAVLLALALPSTLSTGLVVMGTLFALLIGKHVYGGLGQNPFNPAMVGYVFLLISFPESMTHWPVARESLGGDLDMITMATPLDQMKLQMGLGKGIGVPLAEHWSVLNGWWQVNVAYLIGGLYLLSKKTISWHIPLSLLLVIAVISTILYLIDNAVYASPLFHLLSGATMLGAFFIATDPVSAATSNLGRVVYAAMIALLIYVIRTWGGYPEGFAFAVLLMNMAAPSIDHITRPRVFGH